MSKTKFIADAPMHIDEIKVEWLPDNYPDLSWLDQDDTEMGEGFEKESEARKEAYGRDWWMQGCVAKATVSRPCGQGNRRIETFTSGGLWGIESDSDQDYLSTVENDELADLREHLEAFGVKWDETKIER
jgi:hypothetical protein